VDDNQLALICGKHGKVLNCQIKRSPNHQSLGKAYVTYSTEDEAANALKKLFFEDDLGTNVEIDFYQPDIKLQKILQEEQKNELVK